ncbi:hypothetical protein JW926_00135 [Candidatus Sumerlaeota bacterium]|nr:hypothetical protein [Candidatus Sumerlaeota bacterium]
MRKTALFIFIFFTLALIPFEASSAEWTVLIYLDADNNLEPFGIQDVNEMEQVGSDANMNIVVLFDRINYYDTTNGDWTDTRRGLITKDSNTGVISSTLASVGEKNMGDPATLTEFVNWGVTNYPASHYMLVFWNHGGGWRDTLNKLIKEQAFFSKSNPEKKAVETKIALLSSQKAGPLKDVCYDDTSDDVLYTQEARLALEGVAANIDIIAFDACLMQMMEVAFELRGEGSVMVGSEQSIPGNGYPYNLFLQNLKTNPTMTPQELASAIIARYAEFYNGEYTLSAIDLGLMGNLGTSLNAFAGAMIAADSEWSAMLGSRFHSNYYADFDFRDLYGFIDGMLSRASHPSILSTAAQVKTDFLASIIAHHSSLSENAHGLSIYLTSVGTTPSPYYTPTYIQFAANTLWDDMLITAKNKTVPDDSFESNDVFSQAASLDLGSQSGLCCLNDDWFKYNIPENGAITISVFYDYFAGNINLELYNSAQQKVASSSKWLDDYELIHYKPQTAGDYYLRILGYNGDQNYYYDLHALNPEENSGYHARRIPFESADYSGATYLDLGDDGSQEIDLGFSFEYFDQLYDSVRICSNGYLTFGGWGSEYHNWPMPVPKEPESVVAVFWDDLLPPTSGGGVYYKITGDEGKKSLIVTWVDYRRWDYYYGWTSSGATFQAVLSQEEGTIQFNYLDTFFSDPYYDNGASATVGLESEDGTRCRMFSYNEGVISGGTSIIFLPHDYTNAAPLWTSYR